MLYTDKVNQNTKLASYIQSVVGHSYYSTVLFNIIIHITQFTELSSRPNKQNNDIALS